MVPRLVAPSRITMSEPHASTMDDPRERLLPAAELVGVDLSGIDQVIPRSERVAAVQRAMNDAAFAYLMFDQPHGDPRQCR
jgi:hypothetical protein